MCILNRYSLILCSEINKAIFCLLAPKMESSCLHCILCGICIHNLNDMVNHKIQRNTIYNLYKLITYILNILYKIKWNLKYWKFEFSLNKRNLLIIIIIIIDIKFRFLLFEQIIHVMCVISLLLVHLVAMWWRKWSVIYLINVLNSEQHEIRTKKKKKWQTNT